MSQQSPFNASVLRGAVDLSGLGRSAQGAPPAPGQQAPPSTGAAPQQGATDASAAVVVATDANFNDVVTGSMSVPTLLVLWAEQMPESRQHVDDLIRIVGGLEGRVRLAEVELASSPGVMQAITPVLQQAFGQISALPVVLGLLSGQPVPMYLGAQEEASVSAVLDQLLQAAVANGVTGRVAVASTPEEEAGEDGEETEPELPETHQRAYDAIEAGDYDTAAQAYQEALAQNAGDEDARLGLAQVALLQRTADLDLNATRAAAADNPQDVPAQIAAADLDMAGGHVEDAFGRLIETVKRTAGEDRSAAREHLLGLFEVIGSADPRVAKARRSLMSALY